MENLSDDEVLRYGTTEQKLARFEKLVEEKPDYTEEVTRLEKQLERTEEAHYFASELLQEIRAVLAQETRAKDIKKAIELAFSNSYHEE